jgi:mRNA-degrading endonuclease RelE of RelBE toxin-antitoxin system
MKFSFTQKALQDYQALPQNLQTLVDKQLNFLLQDLKYPSLRAKKYDKSQNIWQLRVSRDYRLYFVIDGETYVIIRIIKHPK